MQHSGIGNKNEEEVGKAMHTNIFESGFVLLLSLVVITSLTANALHMDIVM